MNLKNFLERIDEIMCGTSNAERACLEDLYNEVTKPHWISVEDYLTDELPPMLNDKDPYGESVCVLFIVELDGNQYINKGCFDYDIGVWHSVDANCSYLKENVTYWMPLPQAPKEGGEE